MQFDWQTTKEKCIYIYGGGFSEMGLYSKLEISMSLTADQLPQVRFDIIEAARILRISRASLYQRIRIGDIKIQKDGRRSYVTAVEIHRYVGAKG